MTRLAVAVLLASIVLSLTMRESAALPSSRLVRVFATTVQEQGVQEETSDVLYTSVVLRGDRGLEVGKGTLICQVMLREASCFGTYSLLRGRIMVQGTRQQRGIYFLAVVGGTGIYSNAGGTLLATTISEDPRVERLLFSLEAQ